MRDESQSMARALLLSGSSDARLRRASAWLEAQDRSRPVLVLAATLNAGKELLRRTVSARGATFGWRAATLAHVASELSAQQLSSARLTAIGRLASEAIVARVVHARLKSAALGRYSAIAQTPGFARALTSTLLDLRMAGVAWEHVADAASDLGELQRAYEEELREAGLADWPDVVRAAGEATGGAARTLGQPLLLLDAPIRSKLEANFVSSLIARSPNVLATVPAGDERAKAILCSALKTSPEEEREPRGAKRTSLIELRENLFSEHGPDVAPNDDSLSIASAPGENRECVEIARRILQMARQNVRFDEVAILLRSPEEYRPHLEEVLARAEIPAFFERGIVRPDRAGRAFLCLLRCVREGLSARRFAEYLSLAQVPDAEATGRPPSARSSGDRWVPPEPDDASVGRLVSTDTSTDDSDEPDEPSNDPAASVLAGALRAPRRWERLLVDAAVIGGIRRWRRRLEGLEHQLRQSLHELNPTRDAEVDRLRRDLEDLGALKEYALPLLEDLEALPVEASWEVWLDRLGALASRALCRPERVLSILSELMPLGPIGPVDLAEIVRVLEGHLLDLRVRPANARYGKVFVASIEAARGHAFDVVLVPGLAEKLFPPKIVEDPILLDRLRVSLSEWLPTNSERLAGERLALRIAVGAARSSVCLSFPRIDAELARPRVPSFYALESKRAAEGRLPLFDELSKHAETAVTTRVGWPAPKDPAQAIDDTEYDLAVLDSLLDLEPEATLGAAHYLLTANVHLARALRFRARRWLPKWTRLDGLLQPGPSAQAALVAHQLAERTFSPTALQNYAVCPYRFFLNAVHKLAPRDEAIAIEEMDPLQRGSLVHEIQFELLVALRDAGTLPVTPTNLEATHVLLDGVVDRVAARYRDDLAPAIDRVWDDGIAAVRADLREWLRRASEDVSGFVPTRFELSFGLAPLRASDPQSTKAAVELDCGLKLRGSIDLVEQRATGELRVTDHKTGKVRVTEGFCIEGGTSLQAVLYALAAEKLFPGQSVREGRLYYCTAAGGFTERTVPLDDRARAAAQVVVDNVGRALAKGAFPSAPSPGACEFCAYKSICGPHEELRVRRKPQAQFAMLQTLRRMP